MIRKEVLALIRRAEAGGDLGREELACLLSLEGEEQEGPVCRRRTGCGPA